MNTQKGNAGKAFKLSVATLAIMNITAVVSLRGLPSEAIYGLSSAFYYLFAAIVFLIPTSMVAAELAAMFSDKQGGVFRWVGEAFGARTGFLAIWLQWIESTIWYPTVLTFGAVSIAFIGMNDASDAVLASNKVFTLVTVLAIYWLATFIAMKGIGWVGKISKWGGLIGTIIPAGLLIVLGILYISTGGHNNMDMSQGFFPDLTKLDNTGMKLTTKTFTAPTNKEDLDKLPQAQEVKSLVDQYGSGSAQVAAAIEEYGFASRIQATWVITRSRLGATKSMDLRVLNVGDLAFVLAPYEMFGQHGMAIKEKSPFATTLIITLMVLFVTFLLAIIYGFIDPRVKAAQFD